MGLGDTQYSYRLSAVMLQNLGDSGGRTTNFAKYDYTNLVQWFFLTDLLDQRSNFIPLLAAFYYGHTKSKDDLINIVKYLELVGSRTGKERWRWLAQAVFIARYRIEDLELALDLAHKLASHKDLGRPAWTYQMPAFVMSARGEKEAAFDLLINLIKDRGEELHPNEVNFTYHYICRELLDNRDPIRDELCDNVN
jgi:hypothetical protein